MLLNHLTTQNSQARPDTPLDHLTHLSELERCIHTFLLSCKVDGLSPKTIKGYQYQLGRFLQFSYGCKEADPTQLVRLFLLKLKETNKAVSVSDYYKAIKRLFNWLIAEGLIDKNPMQNIKLPRKEARVIQPFTMEDINNLLILTSGSKFIDVRNRAVILLFLDTGLRLSELANIQLEYLDFDREVVKVMGKGAKERVVRIGRETQKALLRYLLMRDDSQSCLWVTEERTPWTAAGIQTTVKHLCHRANVTTAKCGPHTFRHTAAIHCLRNGMGEFALQIMLGHSTLHMTRQYVSSLGTQDMVNAHKKASPVDNLNIKL